MVYKIHLTLILFNHICSASSMKFRFLGLKHKQICIFAGMTLYLCLKTALTEPRLLEMSFNFHLATATWLSEIAINEDCKTFESVKFPLPEIVPSTLTCVPEFIMGNVTDFTLFLQRFKEDMYEVKIEKKEMHW